VPTTPITLEQSHVGDPMPNVYQWRCTKGHVAPLIGMVFSAAMLGTTEANRGALRERRFCFICMVEAWDKLGISEVERVE
jgi:hypothetical protein